MELVEDCKNRQKELLRVLSAIEDGSFTAADDVLTARIKSNAQKTISLYEKIIHLLNNEQIGHA